jgi:uncharacterized membrane protein YtjA (UPF0391 family)
MLRSAGFKVYGFASTASGDAKIFFVVVLKVQVPAFVDSFWVATPRYNGTGLTRKGCYDLLFFEGVDVT